MSLVLTGSTSGSCTLQEQAVAGTTTLTLPTFSGTVGLLVSGTAVASTSGTSIDFTSIPAGVRRITVMFDGVSTNGTSIPIIQLGDSGGVETTSYVGSAITAGGTPTLFTTGAAMSSTWAATSIISGQVVIALLNSSTNIWTIASNVGFSNAGALGQGAFSKTLSATLDRVRITTVGGTDTFDAGSINILYE